MWNNTSVTTVNNCTSAFSLIASPATYILGLLTVVAIITAIGGNIIALFTINSDKAREHPNTKALMMSLFISDELVGLIYLPFLVFRLFNLKYLHDCSFDKYGRVIGLLLTGNSSLVVPCIAFNRYYLLVTNKHNKPIVIKLFIIFSCLVPIIASAMIAGSKGDKLISPVVDTAILIVFAIGPLICMGVCYVKILIIVRNQQRKIAAHFKPKTKTTFITVQENSNNNNNNNNNSAARVPAEGEDKNKTDIKLSKKLAKLILTYALCLLPIVIFFVVDAVMVLTTGQVLPESKGKQYYLLCSTLATAYNSSINPLIYVSKFSEELTRTIRRMF